MKSLLFIAVLLTFPPFAEAMTKAVVVVPVADLRSDQSLPPVGQSDDKQQTQLLFGEAVEVVTSSGNWVYVNAIEQPEYTTNQRWEGYPGWVLRKSLRLKARAPKTSFPVELRSNASQNRRSGILETAGRLTGTPYVWGGLSPHDSSGKTRLTGLDCSGLVHLAYRVNGLVVPRDSHEQWMQALPLKRADLQAADLVFSAKKDNPKKVTHVTIYGGDGQLIEAPQTGMVVRTVSFKEKYGADFPSVESGQTVGDRVIYFGRLLKD